MADRIDFCKRLSASTLVIILFATSPAYAGSVKGRILDETGPVKGATVLIYKSYEDLVAEKASSASAPSDPDGAYELNVPEGDYYFTAQVKRDGKRYYSYHGNNPIRINAENSWISLMVNEAKPPVYRQGTVSLTGLVTYKGQPVKKAWLSFYTTDKKSFKGSGSFSQQAGDDGTFSIVWLPPGKYVLIARKTEGDKERRPLKKGELFCYYGGNPVEIIERKTLQIELPCYAKGARNTLPETAEIKTGENKISGNPAEKREYGIRGKVTDGEGKPVEHIYVVAFKSGKDTAAMPNVSGGVEHVGVTDKDGDYFIPVDSDENLRIAARDTPGGSPAEKSRYGIYGGNPGRIISFKRGQTIDGINIVIGRATDKKKQK